MASVSVSWRLKGNEVLKKATANFSQTIRKSRIEEAHRLYLKALQTAVTKDEKSAALKNLGVACQKLMSIQIESNAKPECVKYYAYESAKYLKDAGICGEENSLEWKQEINKKIFYLVECFRDYQMDIPYQERAESLEKFSRLLTETHQGELYLEITHCWFKAACSAMSEKAYKDALRYLHNCHFPIEEAKRICNENKEVLNDIEVLQEDTIIQKCVAESIQERCIADELLDDQTLNQENISIGMIFIIMDRYKHSIILTREKDVEEEAIAMSRIGRLYNNYLKRPAKAREYYKKSIELGLSMHPKVFTNYDWYQEATTELKRYQSDQAKKEEEKWENIKKVHKEELEKEMALLGPFQRVLVYNRDYHSLRDGAKKLLNLIYEQFPNGKKLELPPDEEIDHSTIKKALQKAIIHYHPDKVDTEKHGMKVKVLSEEITQTLTRFYESFK